MSTPTPAPTPDGPEPPPTLPGVREYEVSIPLYAYTDDGGVQFGRLPVRIPARSAEDAIYLGTRIAIRLNQPAEPPNWNIATAPVTAVDVDDTPSPAELTAQVDYLRRVLAAAVAKYPMLITMTGAEYAAADPAGFHTVPLGDDTVMFASPALLKAGAPEPTPAPGEPAPEESAVLPLPAPLPAGYGGHEDPDVRLVRAHHLVNFTTGQVEIMLYGSWCQLHLAEPDPEQDAIVLRGKTGDPVTCSRRTLVVTRPATVEGFGSDLLPTDADPSGATGRQMLTDQGWVDVDKVVSSRSFERTAKVTMRADGMIGIKNITHDEPVLLRPGVPAGWS